MSDVLIGKRVDSKRHRDPGEWEYECAVCGKHVTAGESTIPRPPMPHAGQRVCLQNCNDQPSFDYYRQLTPPVIGRDEII